MVCRYYCILEKASSKEIYTGELKEAYKLHSVFSAQEYFNTIL